MAGDRGEAVFPNFALKLSEKGSEQGSERGFGRCSGTETALSEPFRPLVKLLFGHLWDFSDSFLTLDFSRLGERGRVRASAISSN
jgi:hypothetical protein